MTILDVTAAAVLLAVPAGLLLVASWNRLRNANLRLARKHRERFFKLAEPLVSDERTPETLAMILSLMAGSMTSRLLPYVMLLNLRSSPPPPKEGAVVVRLDSLPDDLGRRATEAIVHGLLMASYMSVLVGPYLRRRLCLEHKRDQSNKDGSTPLPPKMENLAGTVAQFGLRHSSAPS